MFEPNSLNDFWNPLVERCGLVLDDNQVIELPNLHATPARGFSFELSYFDKYPNVVATWHTHPDGNPNLTIEDYKVFLTQPGLFHYIVGRGIVWGFYVRRGKVFLYEDSDFSGTPSGVTP